MIDILIIGGGIAGLSAAAKVSVLGKTVLLEAEDATGYHTSGRSAAMYLKDYGNTGVRALNYASEAELMQANVLNPRTIMMPAATAERAQFDIDHAQLQLSEISISDAVTLCPILNTSTVTSAAIRQDGYDIDTDLLMQGYIKSARANGADIRTKSRVTAIEKTSQGWFIKTEQGEYSTRILVNAAGAWVDQIAALAGIKPLGFQPYRRSIARVPPPGGHDVSNWAFMIGVGERWYAKPDAGKWLISPEDKDPMDPFDAYPDDMVLAEGIARYQEFVTEPVTRVESSWAGLRTFAPDETLVLGRDAHEPSFIWLAGQGGYGFQTAAAASDLIGDILAERGPQIDATPYSPDRFA
jgi:glycine/D-amino acid oxidase-like deaminating enzyme